MDQNNSNQSLAVIYAGGTMRSAVSALVPQAINQMLGRDPEIVISSSGAVGSTLAWHAGRPDLITSIWDQITHRVINPLHRPMIDIDYLVDQLIAPNIHQKDIDHLNNNHTRLYLPITEYHSTDTVVFGNHHSADHQISSPNDWLQVIKAAKALPLVYGKRIKINGIEGEYLDGPQSSSPEHNILRAFDYGADKVLVVLSGKQSHKSKVLYTLWAGSKKFSCPQIWDTYRQTRVNEKVLRQQFQSPEYANKIMFLYPPKTPITDSTTNQKILNQAMQAGRDSILHDQAVKDFILQE